MKINEMNNFSIFLDYFNNPQVVKLDILSDSEVAKDIDLYYSLVHSGLKTLLPSLENRIQVIPRLISLKYANKWNRIYNALVTVQYDVNRNYELHRDSQGNTTDDITGTVKENSSRDKSEVLTGTSKEDTNISTSKTEDNKNSVFGFNSDEVDGVSNTKDVGSSMDTITGEGEKNKVTNNQTNDTLDTNEINRNTTDKKVGSDKLILDEKGLIKSSSQDLISKEIRMRELNNVIDIMCQDLDTLICLSIY